MHMHIYIYIYHTGKKNTDIVYNEQNSACFRFGYIVPLLGYSLNKSVSWNTKACSETLSQTSRNFWAGLTTFEAFCQNNSLVSEGSETLRFTIIQMSTSEKYFRVSSLCFREAIRIFKNR